MQQVPRPQQGQFGRLTEVMGPSYMLHTPEALRDAHAPRRGRGHPPLFRRRPSICCCRSTCSRRSSRLYGSRLCPQRPDVPARGPGRKSARRSGAAHPRERKNRHQGRGRLARFAGEVRTLAEAVQGAVVLSPGSTGVLPDAHPQNMHVGGSKGSISGNAAMEGAELLIVVGSRAVCQADCSGIGYPNARAVININGDLTDVAALQPHAMLARRYWRSHSRRCSARLAMANVTPQARPRTANGSRAAQRGNRNGPRSKPSDAQEVRLHDPFWNEPVLTQPSAIATVARFAKAAGRDQILRRGRRSGERLSDRRGRRAVASP